MHRSVKTLHTKTLHSLPSKQCKSFLGSSKKTPTTIKQFMTLLRIYHLLNISCEDEKGMNSLCCRRLSRQNKVAHWTSCLQPGTSSTVQAEMGVFQSQKPVPGPCSLGFWADLHNIMHNRFGACESPEVIKLFGEGLLTWLMQENEVWPIFQNKQATQG